ncbi:MAG: hypothetical protein ACW981_10715 [Candidatus Hodarchaeales archaeon]
MYHLSIFERVKFFFIKLKYFGWFIFSHHPLCTNFRKEVFKIKRFFFCRGCAFFYSSLFLSFIYLLANDNFIDIGLFNLFIITNILAFPSFFGLIIKTNFRLIKDIYRILLGVAVSIPFVTIIHARFLEEKIMILLLLFLYFITFKIVSQNSSINNFLCEDCDKFTENACINYRYVFESQREHSRVISDFLQKKLVNNNYLPNFEADDL